MLLHIEPEVSRMVEKALGTTPGGVVGDADLLGEGSIGQVVAQHAGTCVGRSFDEGKGT